MYSFLNMHCFAVVRPIRLLRVRFSGSLRQGLLHEVRENVLFDKCEIRVSPGLDSSKPRLLKRGAWKNPLPDTPDMIPSFYVRTRWGFKLIDRYLSCFQV